MYYILPHIKHVAVLLWEVLEIYFHAVLQKMLRYLKAYPVC